MATTPPDELTDEQRAVLTSANKAARHYRDLMVDAEEAMAQRIEFVGQAIRVHGLSNRTVLDNCDAVTSYPMITRDLARYDEHTER